MMKARLANLLAAIADRCDAWSERLDPPSMGARIYGPWYDEVRHPSTGPGWQR